MLKKTTDDLHRMSADEYATSRKLPLCVVLDNVRSQHNIGAVFRTADAYRVNEIVLCGICCCPPNTEIHKTALGAEQTVPFRYFEDTIEAVEALHDEGYKVYAVEQAHDAVSLQDFLSSTADWSDESEGSDKSNGVQGGLAVVLGHEVFGVQQCVVDACDGCIELPQYGTKHSLNVSVTAGIVIYELATTLISRQK